MKEEAKEETPAPSAKPSRSKERGTGGGVPEGYYTYTDKQFPFSIALPDGWKRTGTAGVNSGAILGGSGGAKVQVDFTSTPGEDAAAAWREGEKGIRLADYRRLYIKDAEYRGWEAADWAFTHIRDGVKYRVLNRGFVVDGSHGYSIMFTAPADTWDSDENKQARKTFFGTFKPTD